MASNGGPRFRLDLVIATLALLASASASIATVVQTRVVANQLSAAVWPYLSFNTTVSPATFAVALENDGLGPALIRNVNLRTDGRRQVRWRETFEVIRSLATSPSRGGGRPRTHATSVSVLGFGPGTVIRPGSNVQIIRIDAAQSEQIAEVARRRVALDICYCSILQKCWSVTLGSENPPRDVDSCGPAGPPLAY